MNYWALTLLSLAFVALFAIPIVGKILHTPKRAILLVESESINSRVTDHVYASRLLHPEIVRTVRLDRHPYFLIPQVCTAAYAICVFNGAELTSNVAVLSESARNTLALCFLTGSILVLSSASMGLRIAGLPIAPGVHKHATSSVLGDDIVLPYRLSMAGQIAVSVSMFVYAYTSFQSTTGSLGGWLTAGLAVACCLLSPAMYVQVNRFRRWDAQLIIEAMSKLGIGEDDGS